MSGGDAPPGDMKKDGSSVLEAAFHEFRAAWADGRAPDPEQFCRNRPAISHELRARIEKFLFVAEGLRGLGRRREDDAAGADDVGKADEAAGENTAGVEAPGLLGVPRRIADFRIIRKIGSGGMGTVFEAEQLSLHRKVALKILAPHLSFSDEAVRKFQREAEAGSRPTHPGIVAIYAVGRAGGVHYIAQELIEGGTTLADRIEAEKAAAGRQPGYFRKVAQLAADAARALGHAHHAGVIHRDVKPSNILLTAEGRPKISDFGLAKVEDALALSRTGDFAGTPCYMSPEQAASRRIGIDHRTDVFSLGVTLYEMLTLTLPFDGETSQEVLRKILLHEPRDPRRINPRVPRDLAVVCLKALEKQPEKRYAGMQPFVEDLERFLSGDVILARPPTVLERASRRVRRNPALSAAVASAAVLLIVLLIHVAWSYSQLLEERNLVKQLSDVDRLNRLRDAVDDLWPAVPANAAAMEDWLNEAESLAGELHTYERALADLRGRGRAGAGGAGSWVFASNHERWLHDTLAQLVGDIKAFQGEDGAMRSVRERHQFACSVRGASIDSRQADWNRAIASIADRGECPAYGGLRIVPQLGLVPIGRDPRSGLWEFAHLATGEVPERDSAGALRIDEQSGAVLVLIPGGGFQMGCDGEIRPEAPATARPAHAVAVRPFFMSKYEMTQAQWERLAGSNPSTVNVDEARDSLKETVTPVHPIENVSFREFSVWLGRIGLRLPSEAEWEYAARAGTATLRWTGDDAAALKGAVNLADATLYAAGIMGPEFVTDLDFDDGRAGHAPVQHFAPNPFGLHNVYGNVCEWCEDDWHDSYEDAPADGSAWRNPKTRQGVARGGAWNSRLYRCSSVHRRLFPKDHGGWGLGARPARSLEAAPGA